MNTMLVETGNRGVPYTARDNRIKSDGFVKGTKMKKFTVLTMMLMAAVLVFTACAPAPAAAEEPAAAAPEATAAPEQSETLAFSLTTLTGDTLDESVFTEHKLIMVNYWATWCGPCVSEIPDLIKVSNDFTDKGFAMIGVLTGDDDIEGAKQFISDKGVTYPVVLPEDFFGTHAEGIYAIPTTKFFDSEGNQIGADVVGSKSYDDWSGLVDLLLGQVK